MLGVPFLESAVFSWFRPQVIDDVVDRMNYFITATLLAFFSIMVSAKQYVGNPIQCWMPMEFKGGWEQYAEDYCFIQDTFFVPFHKEIPGETEDRMEARIGYYQWVPIILALQAVFFYIPNFIWKSLHRQSGIDLNSAIKDANALRAHVGEDRNKETAKMAQYLEEWLEFRADHRSPARIMCFRVGTGLGSYVSMLYIFVKFLYLVNIIGQLIAMNRFLGSEYTMWGWGTLVDLWNGREWLESGVFPRVTLCDFKIRRLANIHRYTVQCVLMVNMFNEKIFLFLWFWFVFVAVATAINFAYTVCHMFFANLRVRSVRTWLSIHDDDTLSKDMIRRFVYNGLRPDGVLLIKFIESHSGAMVARELSGRLYTDYLEMKAMSSTKSTSPGYGDGPHEYLYSAEKPRHPDYKNLDQRVGLMAPDGSHKAEMV